MDEVIRLGAIYRLGPRELTFCFKAVGVTLTNCAACQPDPMTQGSVVGGCHTGEVVPILLTHGWHELRTTADVFVQQVSPAELCTDNVDPVACGLFLKAGETRRFYVDKDCISGGLAVTFCGNAETLPTCLAGAGCLAMVFVNTTDSLILLTENTSSAGARIPSPSPAGVCDPLPP